MSLAQRIQQVATAQYLRLLSDDKVDVATVAADMRAGINAEIKKEIEFFIYWIKETDINDDEIKYITNEMRRLYGEEDKESEDES